VLHSPRALSLPRGAIRPSHIAKHKLVLHLFGDRVKSRDVV